MYGWFVAEIVSRILVVAKLATLLASNWKNRNPTYNNCIWYHDQQHHYSCPLECT